MSRSRCSTGPIRPQRLVRLALVRSSQPNRQVLGDLAGVAPQGSARPVRGSQPHRSARGLHTDLHRAWTPRVLVARSPPHVATALNTGDDGQPREAIRGVDVAEDRIRIPQSSNASLLDLFMDDDP
jgi:hypothetical protein